MASVDLVTVGSLFAEVTPVQAGETLAEAHRYTLVAGGAAANMVFALARLGVKVRFITVVGEDEFGELLAGDLAEFGVDTSCVRRVAGQLTTVSFCSVDRQGGKTFRFYRFPGYCAPMQELTAEYFRTVTDCRLFDFSEGSIREAALRPLVFDAARSARAAGVPVLYAVNLRRGAWGLPDEEIREIECQALALADIAVLNGEEAAFLAGEYAVDDLRRIQALGPKVVIMTRGGDGEMIARVGDAEVSVPPYRVPVIYDVGAGDTFHAGLAAAMLRGNPLMMTPGELAQAVQFAAAAAAIRVSTSADPRDLPTAEQVEAWMKRV
ncbi:MAG: carbohydrate kinase family protein [Armatimonadota bacterium]